MDGCGPRIILRMAHPAGNVQMPSSKKRMILAKAGQQQRKTERALRGTLKDSLVSPKTLTRYHTAMQRFLHYMTENSVSYPSTFMGLDELLSSFVEYCWENGDPKAYVGELLSSVSHFIPAARGHVPGAWKLHGAWSRAELPNRAPPFSLVITYALCNVFRASSWPSSVVLFALGFHAFARSGELFIAKVRDFDIHPQTYLGLWQLPLT